MSSERGRGGVTLYTYAGLFAITLSSLMYEIGWAAYAAAAVAMFVVITADSRRQIAPSTIPTPGPTNASRRWPARERRRLPPGRDRPALIHAVARRSRLRS